MTAASGLGLSVAPCVEGKTRVPAECGTLGVYENRASRSGRIIELHFIVLKAKRPSDRAIFWNPGGPGAATLPFAPLLADGVFGKELIALRDDYNILLVDNRGMGASHSLDCDLYTPVNPAPYFLQLWPDLALSTCRAEYAVNSDLSAYTTDHSTDDLDDLRAVLGYPKLVLDGNSYGTAFSLVYVRRHPERVESVILDGVASPYFLITPLQDAFGAQLAIDSLVHECRADVFCNNHFPGFGPHFAAVARRFQSGPVTMHVRISRRFVTVRMSKEVFADRLRQLLYDTGAAAFVPYVIEQAYTGNYQPLATMIDVSTRDIEQEVNIGANLSYTCAEDIPFITEDAIKRTSADSFLGDSRVRAELRACSIWNVRPVGKEFNEPVRSSAPVLMISGTDDPASPARYGAEELPYLSNARRALVSGASHVTETDCTDRLKIAFVRAGSARTLDVSSCSGAFTRPPFKTSLDDFN